jgi:hypothetical protein
MEPSAEFHLMWTVAMIYTDLAAVATGSQHAAAAARDLARVWTTCESTGTIRAAATGLLRSMAPYLRQVGGLLTIGSLGGVAMNNTVVLPAVLLGHAINVALPVSHGAATTADLAGAAFWSSRVPTPLRCFASASARGWA